MRNFALSWQGMCSGDGSKMPFKGWMPFQKDSRVSQSSDEPPWEQGRHGIFKTEQIRRVIFIYIMSYIYGFPKFSLFKPF